MIVLKQSCQGTINMMVIVGVFILKMSSSIFPIAIVDMIYTKPTNFTMISGNSSTIVEDSNTVRFNWTQSQKHALFGVFLWGHLISEFLLGRITETFGPRRIIGYGTVISSFLTIILPFVFQISYNAAWSLRFVMGFCNGSLRVSLEMIAVRWFPPSERSRFMGKIVISHIGEAFSLLCAGYVISYLGWPSLFYICGSSSLVWSLAWFCLIYDSPDKHPRITVAEKREIMDQMNKEVEFLKKPKKLPLKEILTNRRVWALLVTFIFGAFSYFTFVNYLPTFIAGVLQFNIRNNGIVTSCHYFGAFLLGTLSCNIANYLIKSKKMTTTAVRKMLTGISNYFSGLLLLSLLLWGENRNYCIFVFVTAFSFNSIGVGGYVINAIDIGPNFASTLTSMCFIVSTLSGYTSTKIINATVTVDNTFESWRIMFILLSCSLFLSATIFILFGSGEVQSFNNIEEVTELNTVTLEDKEELEKLKKETKEI